MTIELAPMIIADKHTLGGKPRVSGTRSSVALVLEQMSYGRTIDDLLQKLSYIDKGRHSGLSGLCAPGCRRRRDPVLGSVSVGELN